MKIKILLIMLAIALFVIPVSAIDNNNTGNLTLYTFDGNSVSNVPSNIFGAAKGIPANFNTTIAYNSALKCVDFNKSYGQLGEIYIGGLTPAVESNYSFDIGFERSNANSNFYFYTTISYIAIANDSSNNYKVYSYWTNNTGSTISSTFTIPASAVQNNKVHLSIENNETTRYNTVRFNDTLLISTPYRTLFARNLPYSTVLQPVVFGETYISGTSGWATTHIYNFTQTIHRKDVTAYSVNNRMGFGLDYPTSVNALNGTNLMTTNGQTGTVWADVAYIGAVNDAGNIHVNFTKALIAKGWEPGIHFTPSLTSLTQPAAEAEIDAEMATYLATFGVYPTSWCSLANGDNVTHAAYVYNKYGAVWRNGQSGINFINNIGNIGDNYWTYFWQYAVPSGVSFPIFTHQLDITPAIAYSISPANFSTFSNSYAAKGVVICGFQEYLLRGFTQNTTQISITESDANHMKFTVTTNGYPTNIDVKTTLATPKVSKNNTSVTSTVTSDGVQFIATNGTYIISSVNLPTATFVSVGETGTIPLTVQFLDTSSGVVSRLWDFGDGNTSTAQAPSNIYNDQGTYTVTLTTTNAAGSITSSPQTVTVVDSNVIMLTQLDTTQPLDFAESTSSAVTILSAQTDSAMSGMMGSVIASIKNGYSLLSIGVIVLAAAAILRYLGYL